MSFCATLLPNGNKAGGGQGGRGKAWMEAETQFRISGAGAEVAGHYAELRRRQRAGGDRASLGPAANH
ncbi:hypothetical protein CMUS01_01996 [Colletotrichum musicola]|uniref:Uncharacterized protein n=1 Tax=Colletotrichum musicola TaxID=2175873 RepID=A0A8H6U863_9PEZI|nr:hypothetical protein CMUS01_01996 [Colletotrichum musicola]